MTEAEWLVCGDAKLMLESLRGRATGRKLRLFAVACLRRIAWERYGPRSRKAVGLLEGIADGSATREDLRATVVPAVYNYTGADGETNIAVFLSHGDASEVATNAVLMTPRSPGVHCDLIRDIFPYRPVPFDPNWLSSTVVALARGMYESRDFSAMPILADALQDTGCPDEQILAHCRGETVHSRGCWVCDLILAKE